MCKKKSAGLSKFQPILSVDINVLQRNIRWFIVEQQKHYQFWDPFLASNGTMSPYFTALQKIKIVKKFKTTFFLVCNDFILIHRET